jgi:phosphoribosylformylglycinamidine (FGAM) synthase-like amidotransferase family enzyme
LLLIVSQQAYTFLPLLPTTAVHHQSSTPTTNMNRVALALLLVLATGAAAPGTTRADSAKRRHEIVLRYYTRQQFGVNEFANINASVAAVNGTRTAPTIIWASSILHNWILLLN